jgi:lysophospholipase L1-like esterase
MFKKSVFLILVSFSLASFCAFAQTVTDSITNGGIIQVEQKDNINWIKRYQTDINKYQEENKSLGDKSCDALFLGSSSINLWHNIYNDLAPLKIIRRSYGGATIRDMLYNYDVIAKGYQPKQIVMYVENDLCGCKEGVSVGKTYDLFRIFIQKLQQDYPSVPVYILSFKPSLARTSELNHQLAINDLLSDYAHETRNVFFLDITKSMYDANGKLDSTIFGPDGLHMNQKGYDGWTAIIKPLLLKNAKK